MFGCIRYKARRLGWVISLLSLAFHYSALTGVLSGAPSPPYPGTWLVQLSVLVGLSFCFSLVFIQLPSIPVRILILSGQLFLSIIILIPAQGALTAESLILLVLVLQSGIYLPISIHSIVSVVVIVIGAGFSCWIPAKSWYDLELVTPHFNSVSSLVFIVLAAAVGSGLIRLTLKRLREACDVTSRLDSAVGELVRANQAFQDYAQNAERAATLQERKRISRDIHDSVGHALMNIVMILEAMLLLSASDHEKITRSIRDIREEVGQCLQDTRRAVRLLREPETEQISTSLKLTRLANTFAKATGVSVRIELTNTPVELPTDVAVVLYRTLQEGLTNALRHGKASQVLVHLQEAGNMIILNIVDNGYGVGAINPPEGVGLAGIRERVESMGGRIRAGNGVVGFELTIEVPRNGIDRAPEASMVFDHD